MKLSKVDLAKHRNACALIERAASLSLNEIETAFTDWHEGGGGDQTAACAFFTPVDMASDLRFETRSHGTLVDLCAGIGRLAYFAGHQHRYDPALFDRLICVERNPAFVEVGRKLMPYAEWICGDVLDPAIIRQIGTVDQAICNPPFGTTARSEFKAPRYKGARIDLAVMDVAATVAPDCWAIVPANVATWDRRGDYQASPHAEAFTAATGLGVHRFSCLDADYYREGWRGTSPSVEIVGFGEEYEEQRKSISIVHGAPIAATGEQLALFA